MTASTADQMRQWRGPAILSFGFRPMFLAAGLWGFISMALWIAMLSGHLDLPTRFDPVTWHSHEFLFGYMGAVIAGFLLTAVPNWTGRLPVVGWPLGGLALLWVLGRLAIAASAALPPWLVAATDMSFLTVLALVVLREIVAGKTWKNLPVLALVALLSGANLLFHWEAAQGSYAAQGFGLRLGVAVVLGLVTLIGGKIIPSFTRNWLVQRCSATLPVPPMQRFDKAVLAVTLLALTGWSLAPEAPLTGVALLIVAVLHTLRLRRWQGKQSLGEPLVWVLHIAYGFIPLGALALAVAILWPQLLAPATALHLWTAGAIGLMTLAVMTRATRGHSGHDLMADRWTVAVYLALVGSVALRVGADLQPDLRDTLLYGAGALWLGCFAGFIALYGPMLVRAKRRGAAQG